MNFDSVYKDYWSKVFRLCRGYVGDDMLAQDLAQETFVVVWQKLPEFRQESKIGTWIYRIATNHCLRQLEKEKRMIKEPLPVNLPEEDSINQEPQFLLLYRLIGQLPEIDRIIIGLSLEKVKYAEIAEIVGLSENNIRVKIHRIKERLTQEIKRHGTAY